MRHGSGNSARQGPASEATTGTRRPRRVPVVLMAVLMLVAGVALVAEREDTSFSGESAASRDRFFRTRSSQSAAANQSAFTRRGRPRPGSSARPGTGNNAEASVLAQAEAFGNRSAREANQVSAGRFEASSHRNASICARLLTIRVRIIVFFERLINAYPQLELRLRTILARFLASIDLRLAVRGCPTPSG